jgi:hypothetical protein
MLNKRKKHTIKKDTKKILYYYCKIVVPKIKNRKKKPTFILELKVARKQNYKENKREFQIKKKKFYLCYWSSISITNVTCYAYFIQ